MCRMCTTAYVKLSRKSVCTQQEVRPNNSVAKQAAAEVIWGQCPHQATWKYWANDVEILEYDGNMTRVRHRFFRNLGNSRNLGISLTKKNS